MRKNYTSKIMSGLLCLLLYFAPFLAISQEDSLKTLELDEVMVSATRTKQEVFDIGRHVSVISSEEIETSIYNNVAELLSKEAGIYIVGTHQNPGMNQSLFLRGASSNHTTILVDGIRITDPSTPNTAMDLSELSLINVERIEIVRGSHGTMYGTSGIGGVINIITKKGQGRGFNGHAIVQAGTFGKETTSFKESVFANYSFKNGLYVNLAAKNSNVKGMNASIDTISAEGVYKTTDQDGFDKLDALIKIGYEKDRIGLFASYKYIDQQADIDDGAFNDDDNYTLDFHRDLVNYGGSYTLMDNWHVKINGGWSSLGRFSKNDSSIVDNVGTYDHNYFESDYKGTTWTNELQTSFSTIAVDMLLGIGHYDEKADFYTYAYSSGPFAYISRTDYDSVDLTSSTKYLFLQMKLNGRSINKNINGLNLVLGGRYSNHNRFGQNFDFEINPSYKIGKSFLIYASYSTGFNAPSLVQLFAPNKSMGSLTTRGNKNLEPEISATFELGLKKTIGNRVSFTVAYFNTQVHNAIEYIYLWDKNTSLNALTFNDYLGDTYMNISEQNNKGMELSAEAIMSKSVTIRGGFSHVRGTYTYSPDDVNNEYVQGNHVQLFSNGEFINKNKESEGLVRRPVNMANVQIDFKPTDKLRFTGSMRFVGERDDSFYDPSLGPFGALNTTPVQGYTLVDLSAYYILNEHLSLGIKVENILDDDYLEIRGYNTKGRGIYFKVRASL